MTEDVKVESRGRALVITLDRPKALNALTLDMVRAISEAMKRPGELVIIRGEGRGFCAGGDMRAIWEEPARGRRFFAEEYRMNLAIARSQRPWVALIDGVAMGGGLGISVHGSHRVVTEKAVLAMPETAIGMIPDVGGSYFLARLGERGRWMALTGSRVGPGEAIELGLATHFVPSERLGELQIALENEGIDAIGRFAADPPKSHLPEWNGEVVGKSPTSVAITERLLKEGATRDLAQCLNAEYRAVRAVTRSHDFREGVRAVLVDKSYDAKWQLERDVVKEAFESPPEGDLELT